MQKQSKGTRPRERARAIRAPRPPVGETPREAAIDRFLPVADIVETRHVVVDVPPAAAHAALHKLDFADIPSPLVRALMRIGLRAMNRARRRLGKAPLPRRFTLENLEQFGRILLADEPGKEIVIGAIARPGDVESMFVRRTPADFIGFDCPGHIKAVASFQTQPHGAHQTLLTYETRIRATDTDARRKLFAMDRLTAPLSRLVMARVLRFIESSAELACGTRTGRAIKES
jgi:hypothetical protein